MDKLSEFIVTARAMRPNSQDDTCFYCRQPLGDKHKLECVLINKIVTIQAEYEIEVPASWDEEGIEMHRNASSWCANNMIAELEKIQTDRCSCLCGLVKFTCPDASGTPYLDE